MSSTSGKDVHFDRIPRPHELAALLAYLRNSDGHGGDGCEFSACVHKTGNGIDVPPAIARLFFAINVVPASVRAWGHPEQWSALLAPALIADVLILAGIIHDMRTRGRPIPRISSAAALCSRFNYCAGQWARRHGGLRSRPFSCDSAADAGTPVWDSNFAAS